MAAGAAGLAGTALAGILAGAAKRNLPYIL